MLKSAQALLLAAVSLCAQTAFDVASVKPSDPNEQGGRVQFLPGGRFTVENCYLKFIIQRVYEVKDYQIVEAPKWISDWAFRFDIQAKGDPSAPPAQLREMARTLLADRFQLKVHRESRELPVYALVAAKKGFRLHVGKDDGGRLRPGGIEAVAGGVMQGRQVSMEDFVRAIAPNLDRPLLDATAYTRPFDFRLEWAPDTVLSAADSRPSLFDALESELGLKLEPRKAPVEVLVIDRVAKPSPN